MTKMLDDGSFNVHIDLQQALFNNVQGSMNDARPEAVSLKKLNLLKLISSRLKNVNNTDEIS